MRGYKRIFAHNTLTASRSEPVGEPIIMNFVIHCRHQYEARCQCIVSVRVAEICTQQPLLAVIATAGERPGSTDRPTAVDRLRLRNGSI